jgi:hypothetical protein
MSWINSQEGSIVWPDLNKSSEFSVNGGFNSNQV